MNIYPREYETVGFIILGLFFGLLFFYPYIQAEVLTAAHYKEFDSNRFCRTSINPDFKKLKVVAFERYKGNARLYCLFKDTKKNYSLNLYFADDSWRVEYTRNLSEGAYWPIYY
jgi:hypothetical protein